MQTIIDQADGHPGVVSERTTAPQPELSRAERNAAGWLESIREYVAAADCDYDRLEELRDERDDWDEHANDMGWAATNPDDAEELAELEKASGEYADADAARDALRESVLSVQVRSGWADTADEFESEEFCILLSTGGPALRIVGGLAQGQPHTATLEYQDWGTSWTEFRTTSADDDVILKFVSEFYFGD